MHIMSGVMNPLQTLLGVMTRRSSSSRALMLPSFEAVYPRAYSRRPTSTMSARSWDSEGVIVVVVEGDEGNGVHNEGTKRTEEERSAFLYRKLYWYSSFVFVYFVSSL